MRALGFIPWAGASQLDGRTPIRLCATGLKRPSKNVKTGPMVQTWIQATRVAPGDALGRAAEAAICGGGTHACPHSSQPGSDGSCYVDVHKAPRSVHAAAKAGTYARGWRAFADAVAGRYVRLGAYGDPAAVPVLILQAIAAASAGWTGYTRQWQRFPTLARLCMASVSSSAERARARALGFRTFRTIARVSEVEPGEILCPASAEGGFKTQCIACRLCDGSRGADDRRKDVAIVLHGAKASKVLRARLAADISRQ